MSNRSKSTNIGAADRSIQILEILRESGGSTVAELSEELPISKSSIYKHLTTLLENDYVTKDGEKYLLSLRFVSISEDIKRDRIDSYAFIKKTLKDLANQTDETVWFAVKYGDKALIVDREVGDKGVKSGQYHVGAPAPLHASATGKSILAFLPEEQKERILSSQELSSFSEDTTTNTERIREELSDVRKSGVAFNNSESVPNIRAVGVPILDPNNEVLGSISISGPESRMKGNFYREELPDILIEKSNIIEIQVMTERGNKQ